MEKEIYTTKELAERWGISQKTIQNWRWEGKTHLLPPPTNLGGRARYRYVDILEYEAKRLTVPPHTQG